MYWKVNCYEQGIWSCSRTFNNYTKARSYMTYMIWDGYKCTIKKWY